MRKFILPMIPYPSGHLHMGHLRVYSITDTISRYLRLKGHKTIVPIGFDSFGLPAENAAIDSSLSPFTHVSNNIHTLSKQLSEMRFDCDWETLINTCDPSYYKHTQALFLDLLDHGLVTQKLGVVNWDPVDCTVLANEQVINGRAERSGALVEKKNLLQWYFMTTLYKNVSFI